MAFMRRSNRGEALARQKQCLRQPDGMTFPLTAYIEAGLELARYDKLEEGSFAGEIPELEGVIAFGKTLKECQMELRSTLEDWILIGFHFGHRLPVIAGLDLYKPSHADVAPVQTP